MASFFTVGETKVRPGVYYRYENYTTNPTVGADDGKCACVVRSNWGPTDSAVLLNSSSEIATYFGDGGLDGTLEVPTEQFKGGAKSVRAVRLGTGGTKGSCTLFDENGTAVLVLSAKYPGSRELSITIRPTLAATYFSTSYNTWEDLEENTFDELEEKTYEEIEEVVFDEDALFELLVLEGTTELECIQFYNPSGEKNVWNLVEKSASSNYFTLSTLNVTDVPLELVTQELLLGGTDPYVSVNSYSTAFEVLETYRWNVLALDTDDTSVALMTQCFLNRIYEDGKFAMAVVGDSTEVDLETRLSRASVLNDYQMIYVGSGFVDSTGKVYQGYLAAAHVSGMVAGTPSNQSITRLPISGAVDLVEYLTSSQYEAAINQGMLTFSVSPSNTIWVEQGLNTLVTLSENMDAGWKKIKRTKVRFELMQRLNDVVEPLVGRVNNDADGQMTIIQVSNAICQSMVAEGKLLSGAKVELDESGENAGDSATFVVYADDVDAMEKLYFGFQFRFSPEE